MTILLLSPLGLFPELITCFYMILFLYHDAKTMVLNKLTKSIKLLDYLSFLFSAHFNLTFSPFIRSHFSFQLAACSFTAFFTQRGNGHNELMEVTFNYVLLFLKMYFILLLPQKLKEKDYSSCPSPSARSVIILCDLIMQSSEVWWTFSVPGNCCETEAKVSFTGQKF